jgi:hypothetical protein
VTPPDEPSARRRFRRLFSTDTSLTILLISLFVLLFLLYPFSEAGEFSDYVLDGLALLILISGAYTVSARRETLVVCIALAGVTFTAQILLYIYPSLLLLTLRVAFLAFFLCVVSGVVLYGVLREGRVTAHRVGGAVAVYLMLGLIWGNAYLLVFIHDPASFDLGRPIVAPAEFAEIQTRAASRLIYFSFVTMTTLGYGDVKPQTEAAETLSVLQALVGQIYLVVILARIVSLLVDKRNSD